MSGVGDDELLIVRQKSHGLGVEKFGRRLTLVLRARRTGWVRQVNTLDQVPDLRPRRIRRARQRREEFAVRRKGVDPYMRVAAVRFEEAQKLSLRNVPERELVSVGRNGVLAVRRKGGEPGRVGVGAQGLEVLVVTNAVDARLPAVNRHDVRVVVE